MRGIRSLRWIWTSFSPALLPFWSRVGETYAMPRLHIRPCFFRLTTNSYAIPRSSPKTSLLATVDYAFTSTFTDLVADNFDDKTMCKSNEIKGAEGETPTSAAPADCVHLFKLLISAGQAATKLALLILTIVQPPPTHKM
jgi:hypothetical protein